MFAVVVIAVAGPVALAGLRLRELSPATQDRHSDLTQEAGLPDVLENLCSSQDRRRP